MSECPYCQNTFEMQDTCSDEFRMWQGLQGPYYIPSVDENGVISWTNTGGLPNPDPEDISGPPGKGLNIKGVVATVGDLPEDPEDGDTYLVGATDPYDGYIWLNGTWVELGDISKGETGEGVPTGGSTGQVLKKASNADYDTEWGIAGEPATSAPKMDGTAAVGTSTKYAREDHVHPLYDQFVRPNLLDNWYFVGGGSQQGGHEFPINQRGQTSYTGSGALTIDRWSLQNDTNLQVLSGGVKILGKWDFRQDVEMLPGGIYTATVLLSDYQSAPNVKLYVEDSNITTLMQSTTVDNGLITCTMSSAGVPHRIGVNLGDGSGSSNATITAIKLELGDTQTLAHKDNGVWVLNELPDYEEQVIRCKTSIANIGDTYANQYVVFDKPQTWNSTFTDSPNLQNGNVECYKMGKFVVLSLRFESLTTFSWYTIPNFAIPSDFRPAGEVVNAVFNRGGSGYFSPVKINESTGEISIDNVAVAAWYSGTFCYIAS